MYYLHNIYYCHECNSGRSPNVLVGPRVKKQVQLAAIDCHSVACVLEATDLRVTTKSRVSGVFSGMDPRSLEFQRTPEL